MTNYSENLTEQVAELIDDIEELAALVNKITERIRVMDIDQDTVWRRIADIENRLDKIA